MKTVELGPRKLDTLGVVVIGLLMAVQLVLGKFSIGNQFIRFSLAFLATALLGMWFGALWAGIAAALTDIIGATLSGGPYFWGFTISAVLGAMIYAIFFYQQKITWSRVIIAQLLIMLIVNTFLNTLWLTVLYHSPFWGIFPMRLIKELIISPVQVILIYWIGNNHQLQSLTKRF